MSEVECIWPLAAQLGEGPMYSSDERALWFVDIKNQHIHRYDEANGETKAWKTHEFSAFIFPHASGKYLCGMKSGLYEFDPAAGIFNLRLRVDAEYRHNRLNDGCVDAQGRLWFGTMDNNQVNPSGSLYCFANTQIRRCDAGYVITNGPAISPDGKTLYHVDTLKQIVYAFDLDSRGMLENKRVFLRIEDKSMFPDGPVVDSVGNIWISMFGGWGVYCYSPRGELLEVIKLPVSNVTKIAFGGEDLKSMYITTAWVGLNDEQRAQQPLAGGLFRTRVSVAGLPQNKFAG